MTTTEQEFREALAQVRVLRDVFIEWVRIVNSLVIPAIQAFGEAVDISDEELEWVGERTWDNSALPFRAELV